MTEIVMEDAMDEATSSQPPEHEDAPPAKKARLQKPPAMQFPFTLDTFQSDAIAELEGGNSVLVSAHTSAGKTVVAEYAIAMCVRENKRCLYTSPIKALSNQKFRDFSEKWDSLGLMTGDITLNPKAHCIVMTTEILRSMLYRGSEMMREVGCVIFDEIHYMRDKHRGVVWEETIIMLPEKVQYVFLSATIPNGGELAGWVEHIHPGLSVKVVHTDKRPTPLRHYLFPHGAKEIYQVVDDKAQFHESSFRDAMAALVSSEQEQAANAKTFKGKGLKEKVKDKQTKERAAIFELCNSLQRQDLGPIICFCFSKRECENLGMALAKVDFTTEEEKQAVDEIFTNAISSLGEDDRALPQIPSMLAMLKRGVGIHHSGLLPILKEVVEIMFGEQFVKVLFSTETFSMGLNMPARTVVFTSIKKWDGVENRFLTSGEYIQMSGRAGRRGLDQFGNVVMMIDSKCETDEIRKMCSGKSDTLNSSFCLTFSMVLNLLRVEEVKADYVATRSFSQYQHSRTKPDTEKRIAQLTSERDAITVADEDELLTYYNQQKQLKKLQLQMQAFVREPKNCLNFLNTGRLIHIIDGEDDYGWCVFINFHKKAPETSDITARVTDTYILDCCADVQLDVLGATGQPKPAVKGEESAVKILSFVHESIHAISKLRIKTPPDMKAEGSLPGIKHALQKTQDTFQGAVPLLDPIADMKITDPKFSAYKQKAEGIELRMASNKMETDPTPERKAQYKLLEEKMNKDEEIAALQEQLNSTSKHLWGDELKKMCRVLRRLEFIDKSNVLTTRGHMACEINAAEELLITEMIFQGQFGELEPIQIATLLSCLVCDEKSTDQPEIPKGMEAPLKKCKDTMAQIVKVKLESKMEIEEDKELAKINPAVIEVVHKWMNGKTFAETIKGTTVFEGSIIRILRRLEEVLRQCTAASRALGDEKLVSKFQEAHRDIKRDIVFSASLYL
eukprot:TRINITY_DN31653_c0_g1_i1.p1 TRINITY_DN31653_c0_g1~~TRINITY_DN31653_c0_g1_i1.p1  ORF type:complete len:959 (-),score=119.94 TRINITY_DN31653_c0_g1_i1:119-2995(-)